MLEIIALNASWFTSTIWHGMAWKVGLGLFEKSFVGTNWYQKSILDTFPGIIAKNTWSIEDIWFILNLILKPNNKVEFPRRNDKNSSSVKSKALWKIKYCLQWLYQMIYEHYFVTFVPFKKYFFFADSISHLQGVPGAWHKSIATRWGKSSVWTTTCHLPVESRA